MGIGKKVFSFVLSSTLACMFVSVGILQLTPKISEELHKKLYHEYARFSKVHPAVRFGYQIDPLKFMPQIGFLEVVGGTLLLIGPRITKLMSCLMLSSLVVGVMYLKHILKDPIREITVFGLILLLLFIRLNMFVSDSNKTVVVQTTSKSTEGEESKKKK